MDDKTSTRSAELIAIPFRTIARIPRHVHGWKGFALLRPCTLKETQKSWIKKLLRSAQPFDCGRRRQRRTEAFKVNGETVSVAEQKAVYDRAVAQGQPAGPELESQVKNLLIQQTALLQEAKKPRFSRMPTCSARSTTPAIRSSFRPCSGLGQEEPGKRC